MHIGENTTTYISIHLHQYNHVHVTLYCIYINVLYCKLQDVHIPISKMIFNKQVHTDVWDIKYSAISSFVFEMSKTFGMVPVTAWENACHIHGKENG